MPIRAPSAARVTKLLRAPGSWVVGVGAVLAIVSCQEYPFLYRPHQRIATTTVHEIVMRNSDTDILFVIDNSGSMKEEQVNVIRNTGVFIDELSQSENAYRVAVITTDAKDEGHPGEDGGRFRRVLATNAELTDPNPDFGLGVDLGLNIPCANTTRNATAAGLNYLVRPALDSPNLAAERCHMIKDFMATVASLGVGGSGTEAALLSARKAFDTDPSRSDAQTTNAGFLRTEADLAIVMLTDEEDCSRESYDSSTPNDYCYLKATIDSDITIGSLVDFFAALKNSGVRKVRTALIAGGVKSGESGADFAPSGCRISSGLPSGACACWSSADVDFACTYPTGTAHLCSSVTGCQGGGGNPGDFCASTPGGACNTPRCEALPPIRYHAFMSELRKRRTATGFSGGTYEDSICQDQYDRTLLTIARTVVLSNCFVLESPIDYPDTIRLTMRHTDDLTGQTTDTVIPRLDPDTSNDAAQCHDGATCTGCPNGAWQLMDPTTICLQCNLKKGTGDDFLLTALTEMTGFDDGGTP